MSHRLGQTSALHDAKHSERSRKKSTEAQAVAQNLEATQLGPPEPRSYEEMAKQPATWVHHFAPYAAILHAPWQRAREGIVALLSTADTISAVPELIPEVKPEEAAAPKAADKEKDSGDGIKVSQPHWGAWAEQQAKMQTNLKDTSLPPQQESDDETLLMTPKE